MVMDVNRVITSEEIKELIETITGLDLCRKSRRKKVVFLRFVAWKLSRELNKDSLNYLCKLYRIKQHGTILNGVNRFDELEDQSVFISAKKLYNRCYDILVPLPEKFTKKEKNKFKKVIKYVNNLTPIQKLVHNLTFDQEKELTELITLRKKSWEWKSKDTITVYSAY